MYIDFIQKLNTMDELINGMTEDSADLSTIKNQLKDQQDECSKLSYKLKTSANSLDKVVKEKKKMKVEKETIVIFIFSLIYNIRYYGLYI